MTSSKRSLLFLALCLTPALVLAAPATVVPGLEVAGAEAWSPASSDVCTETPAAAVDLDADAQDCAMESGPADLAAPGGALERKPCKACPQQPWCECTYQGHPRVSCDPCCYQTYAGQICTS